MRKILAGAALAMDKVVIYTIGHSTRSLEEFLNLLQAHGIRRLVDVRTVPRSRLHPQFGIDSLPGALVANHIEYRHMKDLGGWRKPRTDSPNRGLTSEGFRGYADYMLTDGFQEALGRLIEAARECPTAILCAEAVPWRCHRSLIADALTVRGISVRHITSPRRADPHKLHPLARVEGGRIVYRCPPSP